MFKYQLFTQEFRINFKKLFFYPLFLNFNYILKMK